MKTKVGKNDNAGSGTTDKPRRSKGATVDTAQRRKMLSDMALTLGDLCEVAEYVPMGDESPGDHSLESVYGQVAGLAWDTYTVVHQGDGVAVPLVDVSRVAAIATRLAADQVPQGNVKTPKADGIRNRLADITAALGRLSESAEFVPIKADPESDCGDYTLEDLEDMVRTIVKLTLLSNYNATGSPRPHATAAMMLGRLARQPLAATA